MTVLRPLRTELGAGRVHFDAGSRPRAKSRAIECMSAAAAIRFKLLCAQIRVYDLECAGLVDIQAREIRRLTNPDDLAPSGLFPRNEPENRIGTVESGNGFAIYAVPVSSDPGEQEFEQRRVVEPAPLLPVHGALSDVSVQPRLSLSTIVAADLVPNPMSLRVHLAVERIFPTRTSLVQNIEAPLVRQR